MDLYPEFVDNVIVFKFRRITELLNVRFEAKVNKGLKRNFLWLKVYRRMPLMQTA